jgi:hypothetical protein
MRLCACSTVLLTGSRLADAQFGMRAAPERSSANPLRKRVAKLRQSGVYPRELRSLSERRKESPCIGQMLDRKSALFLGLVKQA